MSVITLLLMLWLAVFSASGPTSQASPAEPLEPDAAASSSAPSAVAEAPTARPARVLAERFARRAFLPPCGMVDVTADRPGAPTSRLSPPGKAWRCLQDALGVRGAELVTIDVRSRDLTVHTFYRALPDGRLEIWTQRFASTPGTAPRWARKVCQASDDLRREPCAF